MHARTVLFKTCSYIRTKLSFRINKVITLTKYRKFLVTLKLIEQQDNKIWMPQNKLFCYWNWILLLLLVQFSFHADWSENWLYVGVKEIVCIFSLIYRFPFNLNACFACKGWTHRCALRYLSSQGKLWSHF